METTKDLAAAVAQANYRDAGPANTNTCQTCRFNSGGRCTIFDFTVGKNNICNRWRPDMQKARTRHQQLVQNGTAKGTAAKRFIPAGVRSGLANSAFLFPNQRAFPIAKPEDVAAAAAAWGRATRVRASGISFGEFRRKLTAMARRKGPAFAAKLPAAWMQKEAKSSGPEPSFKVFKDAAGAWRWASISSTAFRDKDEEIVSTKALEGAVTYADQFDERGPLRFWHMGDPPIDLGDCDFQAVHGRMLIESGTFRDRAVGKAVAQKAADYQMSIGFRHPRNEPDTAGVFEHIVIFERSLVPKGKAANPFTSLTVQGVDIMSVQKEKMAELERLLGGKAEANAFLAAAAGTQKEAEAAGNAYKEGNPADHSFVYKTAEELVEMEAHVFTAYKAAMKAHEAAVKREAELDAQLGDSLDARVEKAMRRVAANLDPQTAAPTEPEPMPETEIVAALKEMTSTIEAQGKQIKELQAELLGRRKEVVERNKGIDAIAKAGEAHQLELERIKDHLTALTGQAPRAVNQAYQGNGYRPTQDPTPLAEPPAAAKSHVTQEGGGFYGAAEELNRVATEFGPAGQAGVPQAPPIAPQV